MIKRLFIITCFTGLGQIFSIYVLKLISTQASDAELRSIGEVDSTILLIVNLLAMGLQSAAIRDLAQAEDWKSEFRRIQSARLSMGLMLAFGSLLAFINPFYLAFAVAPFLAISGDYALYARGKAVAASIIAFVRIAFPFIAVLVAMRYGVSTGLVYAVSMAFIFLVTHVFISKILLTPFFTFPVFRDLSLYLATLPLGIVILSMYFIGLGLVLILPYFYEDILVKTAFVGLKFYMIFKGVLRIIHQAFIKEMSDDLVCLKVDQLTSLTGIAFFSVVNALPDSFIRTFFGSVHLPYIDFFRLLAAGGLIYSIFSSLIIKALLEKRDRPYAILSVLAAIVTIGLSVALSFISSDLNFVGISIVIGEAIFTIALIFLIRRPGLLKDRGIFFLKNIPLLLLPFIVRYIGGDTSLMLLIACLAYGALAAGLHYKKFTNFAIK